VGDSPYRSQARPAASSHTLADPSDEYSVAWGKPQEYRGKILVLVVAYFASELMALFALPMLGPVSDTLLVFGIAMPALIAGASLPAFACPRCRRAFYRETPKDLGFAELPMRSRCMHRGIKIGTPKA
jgi:hypothetical protein